MGRSRPESPFSIIPLPPSAGRGVVASVAVLSGGLVRAVDGLGWICRRRMRSSLTRLRGRLAGAGCRGVGAGGVAGLQALG